jgi:hypothetical protein
VHILQHAVETAVQLQEVERLFHEARHIACIGKSAKQIGDDVKLSAQFFGGVIVDRFTIVIADFISFQLRGFAVPFCRAG